MHKYTAQEIQFLREIAPGHSYAKITELFNARFGFALGFNLIRAALKNHNIRNGRDCRFYPGQSAHNKGKKKWWKGGEATQFKKGQVPWNYKPVGSERVNADGYLDVKVADPKTWRAKHVLIWEAEHGPVPKGHAIIFADGNKMNVTLENLLMVSRRQLAVLNKKRLIAPDADLTRAGVAIANIHMRITERKRNAKRSK